MEITKQAIRDQYNAAIDYVLDDLEDGYAMRDFLILWREGDWEEIKKHYSDFKGPFPQ